MRIGYRRRPAVQPTKWQDRWYWRSWRDLPTPCVIGLEWRILSVPRKRGGNQGVSTSEQFVRSRRLYGATSAKTWTLKVYDGVASNTGTLDEWSLEFW